MGGMAAFFLTLLFYIAGFNQLPLFLRWEAVIPVLAVTGAFSVLSRRVRIGLRRRKGDFNFLIPVVAYAILLSLMWLAALTTLLRPGWVPTAAILVSLGGGLFFLSNSLMAYHRFVRPIRYGDFFIMVTYHLGQILIAGGALEQFLMI